MTGARQLARQEEPMSRPRPRDLAAAAAARAAVQRERGDERVLAGLSRLRSEAAYEAAAACSACAEARAAEARDDALCDEHLAHALGMRSRWDAPR
jgi:hypothetical protein